MFFTVYLAKQALLTTSCKLAVAAAVVRFVGGSIYVVAAAVDIGDANIAVAAVVAAAVVVAVAVVDVDVTSQSSSTSSNHNATQQRHFNFCSSDVLD